MIPRLEEVYAVVPYEIDDAMLEAEPPRPYIRSEILEGFGLAEPGEGVAQDVQDELEDPDGVFPVYPGPVGDMSPGYVSPFLCLDPHENPARLPASYYVVDNSTSGR
jgi:hypothetical protein